MSNPAESNIVALSGDQITPIVMLERAVSGGADIEVLERLMEMSERYQANQAMRSFAEALSSMREGLPAIVKTKSADFGRGKAAYKYEDLSVIVEQLSPCLSKAGLSFRWRTDSTSPGMVSVTCIVSHAAGHFEETTLTGPLDTSGSKNAIQAIGSVVTYLQRYTLKAAIGIAAGVDDDGQQQGSTQQTRQPAQAPPQVDPPTSKMLEKFRGLLNWANAEERISSQQYKEGIEWLDAGPSKGKLGAEIGRWQKIREDYNRGPLCKEEDEVEDEPLTPLASLYLEGEVTKTGEEDLEGPVTFQSVIDVLQKDGAEEEVGEGFMEVLEGLCKVFAVGFSYVKVKLKTSAHAFDPDRFPIKGPFPYSMLPGHIAIDAVQYAAKKAKVDLDL